MSRSLKREKYLFMMMKKIKKNNILMVLRTNIIIFCSLSIFFITSWLFHLYHLLFRYLISLHHFTTRHLHLTHPLLHMDCRSEWIHFLAQLTRFAILSRWQDRTPSWFTTFIVCQFLRLLRCYRGWGSWTCPNFWVCHEFIDLHWIGRQVTGFRDGKVWSKSL